MVLCSWDGDKGEDDAPASRLRVGFVEVGLRGCRRELQGGDGMGGGGGGEVGGYGLGADGLGGRRLYTTP